VNVSVRLFAALRERAGTDQLRLEGLPDDLDVAGLKRELERRHPELGDLGYVRGVLGTRYVDDATPVGDADEVAFLPPVSGGAPAPGTGEDAALLAGIFELSADPLDPAACQRRVAHPTCGGVVLFTGTTRERNRGQDVARLDYEAFAAMAGPEMARIFAECRERFAGEGDPELTLRMLCQHRTGVVEVGQPSVAIAVASPHRAAAFDACRFLIDTLKERLPVWKKEIYGDGHHWIGDRS
jgi:molybdopterin synthase catalytic subunit